MKCSIPADLHLPGRGHVQGKFEKHDGLRRCGYIVEECRGWLCFENGCRNRK